MTTKDTALLLNSNLIRTHIHAIKKAPFLFFLISFISYTIFSIYQWNTLLVPHFDLAIFSQLIDSYSHFHAPIVDIKGPDYNLLGDHWHPLLIILTPLYWIAPSPLTLLIAQNFFFALSAIPLVRFAYEKLSRKQAFLFSLSYVCSFGVINAILGQFHEIALAMPLFSWGLIAWMRTRYFHSSLILSFLVLVKEDLGVTLAFFGVITLITLLFHERKNNASLTQTIKDNTRYVYSSLFFIVWGGIWFILTMKVLIPFFNTSGHYDYSQQVSVFRDIPDFYAFLWERWPLYLSILFLIVTAGIIGVRSPYFLLILPTLFGRFWGGSTPYWEIFYRHYNAILMPMIFVALLDVLIRHKSKKSQSTGLHTYLYKNSLSFSLACSLILLPISIYEEVDTHTREHMESAQKARVYAQGYKGKNILTDYIFLSYAAHDDNRVFYTLTLGDYKDINVIISDERHWILDDVRQKEGHPMSIQERAETFIPGSQWKIIFSENGYQVLERIQ
ncbi:MAG: DUF2079 domain-containing protein [Actinomycetaceae bacterium]|nr:DUF2079 domain-containing protein [Actinomycetaceae bacterium]